MIDTQQIHPLTDFLRNHKAHVNRLKKTRTPEVLTINDRAELVVLDVKSYQAIVEKLDRLETIATIRESVTSAERGELKPAEQILAEMRAKYGLQG